MINIQHDVVGLLYSIKGRIETHFGRYEAGGAGGPAEALPEAHAALRKVYDQAQKAIDVTRRFGQIVKEGARRQTVPSSAASNLRRSWDEALACLRALHSTRQIEYLEHVPGDFPNVACCQDEFIEMLYYIAENAIQAMAGKGRLIIRANLGSAEENVVMARISIADTGAGMSADVLRTLFLPFVTTKQPGEGNGLGLCLVQGLARRNHGDVSIASFEGFGTTVTLSLPIAG